MYIRVNTDHKVFYGYSIHASVDLFVQKMYNDNYERQLLCGNPYMYVWATVPIPDGKHKSRNGLCIKIGIGDMDDFDLEQFYYYEDEQTLREDFHEVLNYMKDLEYADLTYLLCEGVYGFWNLIPTWLRGKKAY